MRQYYVKMYDQGTWWPVGNCTTLRSALELVRSYKRLGYRVALVSDKEVM